MSCNQSIATVTYDKLADEVTAGSRILLDDGRVEMKVERVDQAEQTLHCSVTVGGVLSNNKGVNFPDVQLSVRALTEKDKQIWPLASARAWTGWPSASCATPPIWRRSAA